MTNPLSQDAIRHGLDVIARHRGPYTIPTITGPRRGSPELLEVRARIAGQLAADGWSVPMIAQLFPGRSHNLLAAWVRKAKQMRRDTQCAGLGLTPYRRDPKAKKAVTQ